VELCLKKSKRSRTPWRRRHRDRPSRRAAVCREEERRDASTTGTNVVCDAKSFTTRGNARTRSQAMCAGCWNVCDCDGARAVAKHVLCGCAVGLLECDDDARRLEFTRVELKRISRERCAIIMTALRSTSSRRFSGGFLAWRYGYFSARWCLECQHFAAHPTRRLTTRVR